MAVHKTILDTRVLFWLSGEPGMNMTGCDSHDGNVNALINTFM